MRYLSIAAIIIAIISLGFSLQRSDIVGSAVLTTNSSDTLETFRTNVNSSLMSLQNDKVSTTTAYVWTALQRFSAGATTTSFSASNVYTSFAQIGGTATTSILANGKLGVASSSPLGNLGIGTTGATSTLSTGFFCLYGKDEAGRGMFVKLATSGNTAFSTSTNSCM